MSVPSSLSLLPIPWSHLVRNRALRVYDSEQTPPCRRSMLTSNSRKSSWTERAAEPSPDTWIVRVVVEVEQIQTSMPISRAMAATSCRPLLHWYSRASCTRPLVSTRPSPALVAGESPLTKTSARSPAGVSAVSTSSPSSPASSKGEAYDMQRTSLLSMAAFSSNSDGSG